MSYKNNTNKRSRLRTLLSILVTAGLLVGPWAVTTAFGEIDMAVVAVGYAGNEKDNTGYGAVSYGYYIGKYEVTNGQYVAFLNAVAATDTYNLYNVFMNTHVRGGITRLGEAGEYSYALKSSDWALKPVNFVSFYDAARFVNWLTNGQGEAGTTEYGLYVFSSDGSTLVSTPDHAEAAGGGGWVIASDDEWYKAAYYNPALNGGNGGYTDYPWKGGEVPSLDRCAVNGANFSGGPGTVRDVGYYTNATTFFGTYDQGGNVLEWTDTVYSDDVSRVMRGGAFNFTAESLSTTYSRTSFAPASEYDGIGFRVVRLMAVPVVVPEPGAVAGAMGLLVLIIGLWGRAQRRSGTGV
ncbi:MAG: formylglycine-generating enzyme family protein [Opitutaceae bacterium]|nr:formylglycine-generating enzyme family protein [Opitutaceae bacterium]